MAGYEGDDNLNAFVMRHGHYHTGDVATRDADGYITYVGRADDVFKSSDYRISPFELESALIEHEAVAEAAVVPSSDDVRGLVPKAFIILKPGVQPSRELALDIFRFLRRRLAAYKRVRRLEFSDLPKTVSGKIRRVELREREEQRGPGGEARRTSSGRRTSRSSRRACRCRSGSPGRSWGRICCRPARTCPASVIAGRWEPRFGSRCP